MELATAVFGVPFQFLRVPNLKLKVPRISTPKPMAVFFLVYISYFLVLSGLIYDIIMEPPSLGSSQDPHTGVVKPVAFLQYRVNGQYIIEGLSAGFLFSLGGLGFILLDFSNDKLTSQRNRYLLILSGVLCIAIAYNLCLLFLRIKIPGYLMED
mmetsp:Transcript_4854/g.8320  ORF Transcript_4854/g.8320 Transcript_4854/m.8320 type:complete len:154 (+) Transcript_4854:74-535(+)